MKFFEQVKPDVKERKKPAVDATDFIKRNLMKSVDRKPEVYKEVEDWLMSFEGGITKASFQYQLKRLDWDDSVAMKQLEKAKGRRTIPLPPPPQKPKLVKTLVEQMLEDTYVAVGGRGLKKCIANAIVELKQCGEVYVLSVEKLILEFKSYAQKGSAPQMIDAAVQADFLIVVDLELPIHLEWHIREALDRILRLRIEYSRPIISAWNRFNDCNAFFEKFKIYAT